MGITTSAVTATTVTKTIGSICSKCGTIKKSGKRSCCAPGGAWFNNCGASDNSNTEHTWFEGMRACKDGVSLFSGKEESPFIILRNLTSTTQQLNGVEQQTIDSTFAAAYDVPAGNFKDYEQLSHIVVFTSVLFPVFLNFQT